VTGSAAEVAAVLRAESTFVLSSHARPDGDAVGSSLALSFALQALGKRTTVVLHDPVPKPYQHLPGVGEVVIADGAESVPGAAVILECGELSRTEITGLTRPTMVNIDHHTGNRLYGTVNWFDESAAACGELVAELIDALGVKWTRAIATHLYLAISTDTGSFRFGPVSARTFDLCRRIAETGVDTSALSRDIYDSFSIGRVRLTGAMLDAMTLHHEDRFAVLFFDDALLSRCGAVIDDTEGLVNIPLGARDVVAVALIKQQGPDRYRISLRSKGQIDIRSVAALWGGGGHMNAAGCTIEGSLEVVRHTLVTAVGSVLNAVSDAAGVN
jgi:phosphoesterase RecJ-like protein